MFRKFISDPSTWNQQTINRKLCEANPQAIATNCSSTKTVILLLMNAYHKLGRLKDKKYFFLALIIFPWHQKMTKSSRDTVAASISMSISIIEINLKPHQLLRNDNHTFQICLFDGWGKIVPTKHPVPPSQ